MNYEVNMEIIKESISHYGVENQSTVCMEECAELIQAISKMKRRKPNNLNLVEEIADVLICVEMLRQMYGIPDWKIDALIKEKQEREKERMNSND